MVDCGTGLCFGLGLGLGADINVASLVTLSRRFKFGNSLKNGSYLNKFSN